jgi:hypothetical protein
MIKINGFKFYRWIGHATNWELANEATKDWRKLLVKHRLDSIRMNEVTKMNSHEVCFVKTVEGARVARPLWLRRR